MPITPQCHEAVARARRERRMARNAKWVTDENGVVHIPLGDGREAFIDECDRDLASRFTWGLKKTRTERLVYACSQTTGTDVFLHNLILPLPPGSQVDHRDRNGLNCVRSNLRRADFFTNAFNRAYPVGKSGFRGVTPHNGRWSGQIQYKGKKKHLGEFNTPGEAALAYNQAAQQLHGDFAVLNDIADGEL